MRDPEVDNLTKLLKEKFLDKWIGPSGKDYIYIDWQAIAKYILINYTKKEEK